MLTQLIVDENVDLIIGTSTLFGTEDNVVNCKEEYEKYFGDAYMNIFCGHRLTPEVIKRDLLPIMADLLARNS